MNRNGWRVRKETAVQLLNKLFGPHSQNLEKAMDLTTQRAGLLTRNLASVNVPGYQRQDIDFSIEPEGAEKFGKSSRLDALRNNTGSSTNSKGVVRYDGNTVDLETEVMAISEMEVRYQLMSEITNRYFSGLKSVIREGR